MATTRRKLWHLYQCDICAHRQDPLRNIEPGTGRCKAPRAGTDVPDMAIIGPETTERRCPQFLWLHENHTTDNDERGKEQDDKTESESQGA